MAPKRPGKRNENGIIDLFLPATSNYYYQQIYYYLLPANIGKVVGKVLQTKDKRNMLIVIAALTQAATAALITITNIPRTFIFGFFPIGIFDCDAHLRADHNKKCLGNFFSGSIFD